MLEYRLNDFKDEYFVTSDGVKLHYIEYGRGEPLLMFNGFSGVHELWNFNLPELAERYHVYFLDFRGHGKSETPEYGFRISRCAKDIYDFIKHLKIEKANFLGYSMGCSVIWCYIDLYGQDRINKLILVDQAPSLSANPSDEVYVRDSYGGKVMDVWEIYNASKESLDKGMAVLGKYLPAPEPQPTHSETEMWYLTNVKKPPMDGEKMGLLLKNHLENDWRDVIKRIEVPTLYLCGQPTHATTEGCRKWVRDMVKDCKLIEFTYDEKGTHHLMCENPEKFNEEVLKFLER